MSIFSNGPTLDEDIRALRRVPDNTTLEYHAIAFDIEDEDRWVIKCLHTHWVDWAGPDKRAELRASTPVTAKFAENLKRTGIECLFVLDVLDFLRVMRSKQPALVERGLAEHFFPSLIEPALTYHHGRSGFSSLSLLSKGAGSRRPSAKQREAVMLRDGARCRKCKRDPKDFVDMELEIHHIRPWAKGGTSDPTNLITLCRRCHKSLKPHFSYHLFELVEQDDGLADIRRFARRQ